LTAAFLVTVATFINWFILPFYVSDVLGASARAWGVLLMLHAVTAALTSPVGGWLSDRAHPSHTITAAMTVSALAMFWFTTLDTQSSLTDVGMRMVAAGLGMGLFQASNANLIMGNFTRDRLGMGGAVMTLSRSLGTVSSVAIMGALFSARQAARSGVPDVADTPIDPPTFVLAFRDLYTVAGVLAALAVVVSFSYWPWAMRRRSR
jgi:MFS family permease